MSNTAKLRQPANDTSEGLKALLHEAESALSGVTGEASEQFGDLRKRLRHAVSNGKNSLEHLRSEAIHKARQTDQLVRANPYYAIGIAVGIGALLGTLVSRSCLKSSES